MADLVRKAGARPGAASRDRGSLSFSWALWQTAMCISILNLGGFLPAHREARVTTAVGAARNSCRKNCS